MSAAIIARTAHMLPLTTELEDELLQTYMIKHYAMKLLSLHLTSSLIQPALANCPDNASGIEAYRAKDYIEAKRFFKSALDQAMTESERQAYQANLDLAERGEKGQLEEMTWTPGVTHEMSTHKRQNHTHLNPPSFSIVHKERVSSSNETVENEIRINIEDAVERNISEITTKINSGSKYTAQPKGATFVTHLLNGLWEARTSVFFQDRRTAQTLNPTYVWTYRVNRDGTATMLSQKTENLPEEEKIKRASTVSADYDYPVRVDYGKFGDGHSWYHP